MKMHEYLAQLLLAARDAAPGEVANKIAAGLRDLGVTSETPAAEAVGILAAKLAKGGRKKALGLVTEAGITARQNHAAASERLYALTALQRHLNDGERERTVLPWEQKLADGCAPLAEMLRAQNAILTEPLKKKKEDGEGELDVELPSGVLAELYAEALGYDRLTRLCQDLGLDLGNPDHVLDLDAALANRYSFSGNLNDSVGGANGTMVDHLAGLPKTYARDLEAYIAFAEGKTGPGMALTPTDIYKALAAKPFGKPNTAKTWKDVNPALPALPILVYGPPTTSGTRDALAELILTKGCDSDPAMKALKEKDKDAHKKVCTEVREDGAYVDSGEEDNLIVQKLAENANAIGIFGYSFLEENMDKLKGITIDGIQPTYASISDFSYPGARPLYIYIKMAHLNAVPGLKEFIATWPKVWGPDGLLKKKGMVISPEDVRNKNAPLAANPVAMDASTLK